MALNAIAAQAQVVALAHRAAVREALEPERDTRRMRLWRPLDQLTAARIAGRQDLGDALGAGGSVAPAGEARVEQRVAGVESAERGQVA